MRNAIIPVLLFVSTLFMSCIKEYNYDCVDYQINPRFINYSNADLDTLILRKFKAEDNFHTLIDTIFILAGSNGTLINNNDSIKELLIDMPEGIHYGYDWQLYMPSTNKTISVSKIISEKTRGKRRGGIFSLDPGPPCSNRIYSCRVDSSLIDFSELRYHIDITN